MLTREGLFATERAVEPIDGDHADGVAEVRWKNRESSGDHRLAR